MDILTHVALGAVVGQLFRRTQDGKQLITYGIVGQVLPDIDIVASLWLDPSKNLIFHRGITHSLVALVAVPFFLSWLASLRGERSHSPRFLAMFFFVQYGIHLFVDSFNAYGIGLFEPFVKTKYSFHSMYVVDPVFVLFPLIAVLSFIFLKRNVARRRVAAGAVLACATYIAYTVYNKILINERVESELAVAGIDPASILTTPAPLNSFLWFCAAEADSGYFIRYASVFDDRRAIAFHHVPKNEQFLKTADPEVTNRLKSFSRGFYTISYQHDTLVFNDLRFGQNAGWEDNGNPFTFHYYLNYPGNKTVMQRGRFSQWNRNNIQNYYRRVFGDW